MAASDQPPYAATPLFPAAGVGGGAGAFLEPPPSRLRWLMIGLAFLATVINYLNRQTLSVAAPLLAEQFHMSNESYGLVVSAFMVAYTIGNGVSGPLLDRLGTRLGYALCIAWWSAATVLHALARGPWSLGLFRFLLGAGEAGNWLAAVKVVSEWFPKEERALASGIFNSGAAIGAIVATPLVAWVVLLCGWQLAFVIIGGLGYLWLVAWWLVYRTPAHVRQEVAQPPASPWRLLRTRFLGAYMLSSIFLDPVWYFYIFWIPKFLADRHGFSLAQIGATAWIPFLSADVGNLVGGWFTGVLIRRGMAVPIARKTSVAFSAVLMTAAIPAVLTTSAATAIGLIFVATFGYTSYWANALAFPAEVFPRNMVASVVGLAGMGSGIGGTIFGWLSGRLIDRVGYLPVFFAYGLMPLVALAVVLFLMGPLRPHPDFCQPPGDGRSALRGPVPASQDN